MKGSVAKIALVLLLTALFLSGCEDFWHPEKEATVSSTSANGKKTIIVTGVSGEYLKITDYVIYVDGRTDGKIVAQGDDGHLSGSTITCDLYTIRFNPDNSWSTTSTRWTGNGSFDIGLAAWVDNNTHTEWIGRATNIVIDKAVTTIQFSQFH